MKILVTGASGSGTTTLGQALAGIYGCSHLDLDDYYWMPTEPRFKQKRAASDRLKLLMQDLNATSTAIVSGSLVGWGTEAEDGFDLVVFLRLATSIRLERLSRREMARFGSVDTDFLEWAAQYDVGPTEGRSLAKHEAWLAGRHCAVIRIEGDKTVVDRARLVLESVGRSAKATQ